jgi:hypothetical protein
MVPLLEWKWAQRWALLLDLLLVLPKVLLTLLSAGLWAVALVHA